MTSSFIWHGSRNIASRCFSGVVATRLRELIREICKAMDVEIIKGHVSRDHVHLFVSVPPYHSVIQVMKRIKGKTSRRLLGESRILAKQCWGRHLWTRGYFAAPSGNVTDEVIAEYIEKQSHVERASDDDFTVDS